jgi:hypothetical protein
MHTLIRTHQSATLIHSFGLKWCLDGLTFLGSNLEPTPPKDLTYNNHYIFSACFLIPRLRPLNPNNKWAKNGRMAGALFQIGLSPYMAFKLALVLNSWSACVDYISSVTKEASLHPCLLSFPNTNFVSLHVTTKFTSFCKGYASCLQVHP